MGQTFQLESLPRTYRESDSGLVEAFMPELDEMRADVARYVEMDPDEVLLSISGLSGRLAEIRAQLQRSNTQKCTALRTREVDPLRDELELQFRVWSRRIALMEWEAKLAGGGI